MRQVELEADRPVEPRGDDVERILDERAVDRRPAAVAHVHADPRADIRVDTVRLGKDILEVDVADDVADGDPAEVDRIRSRWIHDAIEAPFKPVARLVVEL